MKLIGIAGKAKHGKDTLAQIILNREAVAGVRTAVRRGVADSLKEEVFDKLMYGETQSGWEPWNTRWLEWGDSGQRMNDTLGFINHWKDQDAELRAELQRIGHARRQVMPTYWIDKLFGFGWTHSIPDVLVIPDVRYRNEAQAIRERGGLLIRVYRHDFDNGLSAEAKRHPSETELDTFGHFHVHLGNDGTLADLEHQLIASTYQWYMKGTGYVPEVDPNEYVG